MAHRRTQNNRNPKRRGGGKRKGSQTSVPIPNNYHAMLRTRNKSLWMKAIERERDFMVENEVYETIYETIDNETSVLATQWNFYVKDKELKARVKVVGSEDYRPSSTCTTESVRFLLFVGASKNLNITKVHFLDALQHIDLGRTAFVTPPEGTQNRANVVWKLNKPLYGMRDESRILYDRICEILKDCNYTQSRFDPCFFFQEGSYVCVYADELLVAGGSSVITFFHTRGLASEWEEGPDRFLGMSLNYDGGTFDRLTQEDSIRELTNKYDIMEVDESPLSPLSYTSWQPSDVGTNLMNPTATARYRSILGSLRHFANTVRFDILHAVVWLESSKEAPQLGHMAELKRVVQYLLATESQGIGVSSAKGPFVYYYSDWTHQTTGYVITLDGMVVAYGTKHEKNKPESREEGDFMAMESAVSVAKVFTARVDELDIKHGPIQILGSNPTTLAVLKKGRLNGVVPRDHGLHYVRGLGREAVAGKIRPENTPARILARNVSPQVYSRALQKVLM